MSTVTASDWSKGITLSILASILGGASKLAIRKSWLIQASLHNDRHILPHSRTASISSEEEEDEEGGGGGGGGTGESQEQRESEQLNRRRRRLSTQVSGLWFAYALRFGGMLGMTFLNPLCCVLAMNYASPSVLAPFSGLTLVWIIVLSAPLIHEQPSKQQVVAASFIVLGEVIVALYGDHTNDAEVSIQDVRNSYLQPPFLFFLLLLSIWMMLLFRWMKRASLSVKRFAWGVAGGSVTGLQNFLKDSLTVFKNVRNHNHASFPWWWYMLVVMAAASAFGGLLLLTACMKRYDVTYSSAMFVGSFVVSASIMSAVHYDTFQHFVSIWSYTLYPVGLLVLMSGVWILVLESSDEDAIPLEIAREEICMGPQEQLMCSSSSSSIPYIAAEDDDNQRRGLD